ncbi:SLC13 family permease [Lactiplantibacillus fabifermentans]|uniref:Sodium sulfate symport protein n=1 Tax=Lactiplantibacillus fabifermentans DSM 21115 TaxID=1413187 RepID=A0A0R2NM50_9LACO|nr:SLC13 family permease [Lactiplantibacillus fabifermentans]KRO26817.1 sodium sulfate symport protein [Lactiplantibacillus fabifermentans DSM 21115]
MTLNIAIVLITLLVSFVLMALEVTTPNAVILCALAFLMFVGILSPTDALSGFANDGLATIALMYIIAYAISKSNFITRLFNRILGDGKHEKRSLFKLLASVSVISPFMNNTPIVSTLTPMIQRWTKKKGLPVSKFLIPLSYATILAGLLTVLGTSTNLVAQGLLSKYGLKQFGTFDLAIVGIPITIVGLIYLLTIGYHNLPTYYGSSVDDVEAEPDDYLIEMSVGPDFEFLNQTVADAKLRNLPNSYLVAINRDGQAIVPVTGSTDLRLGDRLYFTGTVDCISDLVQIPGLIPSTEKINMADITNERARLVELTIPDSSRLVNQTVKSTQFRDVYGSVIVAIHRNSVKLQGQIGRIRLKGGDNLVAITNNEPEEMDKIKELHVFNSQTMSSNKRTYKDFLPIVLLVATILVSTLGVIDLFVGLAASCVVLFLTKCVSIDDIVRAVDMNVLFLVASSYALGTAMSNVGADKFIAKSLMSIAGDASPIVYMFLVYFMTNFLTAILSNAAALSLMFPIVVSAAKLQDLPVMMLVMLITIAATADFSTPIGYQTNLIVYGPGHYKFTDYFKVGIPLNLICMVICVFVTYYYYMVL